MLNPSIIIDEDETTCFRVQGISVASCNKGNPVVVLIVVIVKYDCYRKSIWRINDREVIIRRWFVH